MKSILVAAVMMAFASSQVAARDYDLVINNGRVIDPETGLDDIRSVGVSDGEIAKISKRPLKGETIIDASDMIVAPRFIDRNTYTLGPDLFRTRAADGVTTTFNFEEGALDVPAAYAAQEGKALINYGFSMSWGAAREAAAASEPLNVVDGIAVIDADKELERRALTEEELTKLYRLIEDGLKAGAPAVGFGVEYSPGATNREVLGAFALAAKYDRSVQIHMREWNATTDHQDIYEVIAGAAITGGAIHFSHLNSSGDEYTPLYLDYMKRAQANGLAVTTECYPYDAWMTDIRAAFLDDWREWDDARFARFEWPLTGERLTRETFEKYRKTGGFVIGHLETDKWMKACVADKETQIASDGGYDEGKTHPRVAGSNARVLGRFVRDEGMLTINDAIRKMTLLPALSLERAAPQMKRKGRIQPGMDADIVVFDPRTVIDRASYAEPVTPSEGIEAVIVGGVIIRQSGAFIDGVFPGRPMRAEVVE